MCVMNGCGVCGKWWWCVMDGWCVCDEWLWCVWCVGFDITSTIQVK